jgi:hypothetical protein
MNSIIMKRQILRINSEIRLAMMPMKSWEAIIKEFLAERAYR